MQTLVASESRSVTIDPDGPFVMIGEKINPTGREKLAAALGERNMSFVTELAIAQVEAGADILDVNVAVAGIDETALLPEVISAVAGSVEAPISIDSPDPEAIAAALSICPGRPIVNSVSGKEASLGRILPLVAEHGVTVIALCLDDDGIPDTAEGRLAVAATIVERADALGITHDRVVIDPLVLTVGADSNAARVTLDTIALVRVELGCNVNLGASNVSFGLPDRQTLNAAFMALAMGAGASCAITDADRLGPTVRAADLMLGRDDRGMSYIRQHRTRSRKAG